MGIFRDILGIKSPSEHFLGGEIQNPARQPVPTPEPGPGHYSRQARVTIETADDRRPCWARGRKAMFHRWVESAHPVPPRNIPAEQIDEKTRYFQYSSTQALVEFEDGTCARVWPNEVQFADLGGFDEYAWRPMTEGGQDDGAE